MPNVNCCVWGCHANTRKDQFVAFHRLPREQKRRKKWIRLVRNENIKAESQWTSVCSLHFPTGQTPKTTDPCIFPWSAQWERIVNDYNQRQLHWYLAQCGQGVDHIYAKPPRLLPVIRPASATKASKPRATNNSQLSMASFTDSGVSKATKWFLQNKYIYCQTIPEPDSFMHLFTYFGKYFP